MGEDINKYILERMPKDYLKGEIRNSFYVESMMKKCWVAQMKVLLEVDRICKKHGIQYFADWGTLLGTVREQGFIAWDDDMDITMKRSDYIKFCKVAKEELGGEYAIVNIHTEPGWVNSTARIVNSKRVSYEQERLKEFFGCPYAIGLDIFILDYAAPTEEEDAMQCDLMRIVTITAYQIKDYGLTEEAIETVKQIEQMCGVTIDFTEEKDPVWTQLMKLQEKIAMMFNEEEATRIALMYDHAGKRPLDIYPKEYYAKSVEMPFEFITIPVPIGYEEILRRKYGDEYMKPRVCCSSHGYPFYKAQQKIYDEDVRRLCGRS